MRLSRHTLRAAIVLALGGLLLGFPGAARAQTPAIVCRHAGTVVGKPGMTATPANIAFRFTGAVGPCRGSDGSVRSGAESGTGRAYGDCGTRTASVVWTIVWRDKTRSVVDVALRGVANAVVTTGTVVRGAFAGATWRDTHILSGFDPTACVTGHVTKAAYQGAFALTP